MDRAIPDPIITHLRALASAILAAADEQKWEETEKLLVEFDGIVRKIPFAASHRGLIEELQGKIECATKLAVERRDEIGRLISALGKGSA